MKKVLVGLIVVCLIAIVVLNQQKEQSNSRDTIVQKEPEQPPKKPDEDLLPQRDPAEVQKRMDAIIKQMELSRQEMDVDTTTDLRDLIPESEIFEDSWWQNDPDVVVEELLYDSGIVQARVPKKNGKRHGIAKHYYETGNRRVEEKYIDGRIVERKDYYPSGNLQKVHKYNDVATRREIIDYSESGDLLRSRVWLAGKWIDRREYEVIKEKQGLKDWTEEGKQEQ